LLAVDHSVLFWAKDIADDLPFNATCARNLKNRFDLCVWVFTCLSLHFGFINQSFVSHFFNFSRQTKLKFEWITPWYTINGPDIIDFVFSKITKTSVSLTNEVRMNMCKSLVINNILTTCNNLFLSYRICSVLHFCTLIINIRLNIHFNLLKSFTWHSILPVNSMVLFLTKRGEIV
jgi:hypothetical protein